MELKRSILADILTEVIDHRGKTPKKLGGDWSDKGYRALSAKNIKNGNLVQEDSINILPKDLYSKWMKVPIQRGDILLTSEAPLGEHMIWNSDEKIVLSQRLFALRFNTEIIHPHYAHYYISSKEYQHELTSRQSGSTVSGIKQSQLLETVFKYPPLQEQKAIAEVLSSLDDKIELLQKQNETLEALAQTLFRQWFIEEADESWEEAELQTLGSIVCGKTPSKKMKEYYGGDIPFVKIPDMHNLTYVLDSSEHLSTQGSDSQLNKLIPPDSVLVSCIATVGVVSMNYTQCHTNQQINTIIPKSEVWTIYIYLLMKSLKPVLIQYASGGTATMNLNTGQFSKLQVLSPPEETLVNFNTVSRPLFKKIKQNLLSIRTLTQTRDTLLPKLMSGQVRINLD